MKYTTINAAFFLAIQITAWRHEDTGLYGLWHPLHEYISNASTHNPWAYLRTNVECILVFRIMNNNKLNKLYTEIVEGAIRYVSIYFEIQLNIYTHFVKPSLF